MHLNLSRVLEVAMVVEDLDRAVDFYTNVVGWGPFTIHELDLRHFTFRGRPCTGLIKVAITPWDSAPAIELVQPLSGETPFSEFLREHGEGLHHVHCGLVDDLDVVLASLAKDGVETIFLGSLPEFGARCAFVVGKKTHGVILELSDMKGNK